MTDHRYPRGEKLRERRFLRVPADPAKGTAMLSPPQLSELQHAVMRILWDLGEATVSQVHSKLNRGRDHGLASTTVATTLSRMEKKGLIRHRTEGRQFVYSAGISEQEVRRSMVKELTHRLFEGDITALVGHLLRGKEIRPEELAQVKALIEAKEKELEARDDQ